MGYIIVTYRREKPRCNEVTSNGRGMKNQPREPAQGQVRETNDATDMAGATGDRNGAISKRIVQKWRNAGKYGRMKALIVASYAVVSISLLAFVLAGGEPSYHFKASAWFQTLDDEFYIRLENDTGEPWQEVKLVLNDSFELRVPKIESGQSFTTNVSKFVEIGCKPNAQSRVASAQGSKHSARSAKYKYRRKRKYYKRRRSRRRAAQPSPCAAPKDTVPQSLRVVLDGEELHWRFENINK